MNQIVQTTSQEIDRQIATAHAFPRSIEGFHKTALGLVTLDETVAEECIYSLPRSGKVIEGASSRFAEIIASAWGNCRFGARVVDETADFVISEGVFHDLETNACVTVHVQRRIVDAKGKRYGVDMIGVTSNAACSIAVRNAILRGVPKALWQSLFDAAKRTAAGTEASLSKRRAAALKLFGEKGITPPQIFKALGIEGVDDLRLDHLVILRGYVNAINEGETTLEELFAPKLAAPSAPSAPAAPLERPGGKATVKRADRVPRSRAKPMEEERAPMFDKAEADAYLFDFSGRLGQCQSDKQIDELSEEYDSQAAPRMSAEQQAYAFKLIDTARTLLAEQETIDGATAA